MLSGKQFDPRQITKQFYDLIPNNIRFFAVLLSWGYDNLTDIVADRLHSAIDAQQCNFGVGFGVVTHTKKGSTGFGGLEPIKGHGDITKAPGFQNADAVFQPGESDPKYQGAVVGCDALNREVAYFVCGHDRVMPMDAS